MTTPTRIGGPGGPKPRGFAGDAALPARAPLPALRSIGEGIGCGGRGSGSAFRLRCETTRGVLSVLGRRTLDQSYMSLYYNIRPVGTTASWLVPRSSLSLLSSSGNLEWGPGTLTRILWLGQGGSQPLLGREMPGRRGCFGRSEQAAFGSCGKEVNPIGMVSSPVALSPSMHSKH